MPPEVSRPCGGFPFSVTLFRGIAVLTWRESLFDGRDITPYGGRGEGEGVQPLALRLRTYNLRASLVVGMHKN